MRDQQGRRRTIEYVESLLSTLNPSDRILLLMREVEGLSVEEVATVLGIGISAAKLRLFRARNRVRKGMESGDGLAGDQNRQEKRLPHWREADAF